MRALVVAALRGDGYDVTAVPDGGRLLTRMAGTYLPGTSRKLAYDLIISDIRMPICNGLNILEGLRAARWVQPVILMTAFGDESTRSRAEELGAILFDKPFDIDDLRTAVLNIARIAAPDARRITNPNEIGDQSPGGQVVLSIVANCPTLAEAHLAELQLKRAGVDAYVADAVTAFGMPPVVVEASDIAVYVPDADLERARAILKLGRIART